MRTSETKYLKPPFENPHLDFPEDCKVLQRSFVLGAFRTDFLETGLQRPQSLILAISRKSREVPSEVSKVFFSWF